VAVVEKSRNCTARFSGIRGFGAETIADRMDLYINKADAKAMEAWGKTATDEPNDRGLLSSETAGAVCRCR